jgi:Ni,Fe-hydrogenase III large subunit
VTGAATALIRAGARQEGGRALLTVPAWDALPAALAAEPELALLALWAEPGVVHAAFLRDGDAAPLLASAPAAEGRYAALSPARPGAILFERMIRDLWGLQARDAVDLRPWLDHGCWPVTGPLSPRPAANAAPPPQPEFLVVEGEGVHQVPVGPIHGGATEPGHFRFHVQGEAVLRLEVRLGYAHKGVPGLMLGRSPRAAARYAARLSGDSTVAHAIAFARAAEQALAVAAPPRAAHLRALMAELERIHNHLNDWGAIAGIAGLAFLQARCAVLREGVLIAARAGFGHRLMMDVVLPGGVAADIDPAGAPAILAALDAVAAELPALLRIQEGHAGLADRLAGTGVTLPALVAAYAAGGVVGRAAGRGFDARRALPYPPYDALPPEVTVLDAGDVDARVRVRVAELRDSLRLARALLAGLPAGEIAVPLPQRAGEGLALVEGFRGDCVHWLRLDDGGLIRAAFLRDPSWLHWPLLEAAMQDTILADFPLCNKSINASMSGVDL